MDDIKQNRDPKRDIIQEKIGLAIKATIGDNKRGTTTCKAGKLFSIPTMKEFILIYFL